jgi:hypothetical protein
MTASQRAAALPNLLLAAWGVSIDPSRRLKPQRKYILTLVRRDPRGAQFVESETQNDRKRHTQSDKLRRLTRIELTSNCNAWVGATVGLGCLGMSKYVKRGKPREISTLKSGRTQPLLTGFKDRGEALKGRSGGSWRSGRRRSEG